MNIILSILIAILTIFALKTKNKQQNLGVGNRRFIIAIACTAFPYLDRVFSYFEKTTELAYQNTFLWSLIFLPAYALALTAGFNFIFGEKVDAKYLFPSICGSILLVVLFNLLGSEGIALFYPLSSYKFSAHLLHSFDLGLFLVCLTGAIIIFFFKDYRRDIARVFLGIVALYIIAVFSFSLKARSAANDYAEALKIDVKEIYTLAQPLSVFNWRVMIFTKDNKIHDTFLTLRKKNIEFKDDNRTKRVAQLYRPAKKAVWRIYRGVNPNYQSQYNKVIKYYGGNDIIKNTQKFSILKDAINYKQYRCLRFKDLRTEGIRKSLKGNTLFCQNPKTKDVKVLYGTKETYEDITSLF
ncbi:MAG TPA: hypothetical protein DCL21_01270 [Alphaproteobacteria bacterium]|nr:hypothetical protein [Alphaproteobacteria bacterium]